MADLQPPSRPQAATDAPKADGRQSHAEIIPFYDPESGRASLVHAMQRISPDLANALPALLAETPDPDSAVIFFDRLVSESSGEINRLLDRHHFLAHYAIVVFGNSRFLGETLLQNPDLLQSFLREKNLDRSFSREEFHEALARFRSRSFETDVSLLLARFKRREYVRIMLRDALRIAPLAETTAEISALADVLIEDALRESHSRLLRRYETPQHLDPEGRRVDTAFAVLSLGKLGGNELNYSSDVDLIYIFGDGTEPPNTPITNREYFIRLAQEITAVLSQVTREGAVFRIDMRLRPQGAEGELAVSLSQALRYYASTAHDWERQALIKVRHSAGDSTLAREFIRGVQPYVYTTQVNFEAIETALEARRRIHARQRSTLEPGGESADVKLDRGGIRDIEFLVQCLQRVYGGPEAWLRSGGTLFSLQKLHDTRHISGKEFHELTNAYEFLRHLEHRLQLRQGRQTHRLPPGGPEGTIIQRSMEGYVAGRFQLPDLEAFVRQRMAAVAEIYHRVIHQQRHLHRDEMSASAFELRSRLEAGAEHSNQQILERLAEDAPAIYEIAGRKDLPAQARRNLFRFLTSALTSSERYAVLLHHPQALDRTLGIFEASDLLTHILIRHPEEIATLADLSRINSRAGSGYLFESPLGSGQPVGDPVFAYLASAAASYSERLELLRQHFRHRIFAASAQDIAHLRQVYESLAVSTATAEEAIHAALGLVEAPPDLAVMALGRLGSGEFDVLSDADVLFVYDRPGDLKELTRSAERMMQALAAYTRDGMVFPVDARLRPRGGEGDLLVTPAQMKLYFEQEAQPWEALMYTKLRYVAGSRKIAQGALQSTEILFQRFAQDPAFLDAVREMRTKLETTEPSFKTSPGAIYDIDFLTGFLLVKNEIPEKDGTLRDRLWRCAASGVLKKSDAASLDHAAELLRSAEHVTRLVVGRARKWLPTTEHALQMAERLTAQILQREFPRGLDFELADSCARVRQIYQRVVG